MELFLEKEGKKKGDQVIVVDSKKVLKSQLNDREYKVAVAKLKQNNLVCISTLEENKYAVLLNLKNQEKNRKLGAELVDKITQKAFLYDFSTNLKGITSFLEGVMLKDYEFNFLERDAFSENPGGKDIEKLQAFANNDLEGTLWNGYSFSRDFS